MNERPPRNYIVYDFAKITAAPGILWFRPKFSYASEASREKIRGGAIVIANHIGFFDPLYLMIAIWYRRHHFVCTKEFYQSRPLAWLFRNFHCIPIDRDQFSMESLRQITEELKSGHLVSIFPEGRVNTSSQMAPFKSGMILMSLQSGKPIIPVYIPARKHWYSRLRIYIGERLNVREELGEKPSLSMINKAAEMLELRENGLVNMANGK